MTNISKMSLEIDANSLAKLVSNNDSLKKVLVVDCRCFTEYNNSHIRSAVNCFFYSKMMRRRLYDNKVCSSLMLSQLCQEKGNSSLTDMDLVLYSEKDQHDVAPSSCAFTKLKRKCSANADDTPSKFLRTLQEKLSSSEKFKRVVILQDGFSNFRNRFPDLCESSSGVRENEQNVEMPLSSSLSQPCLPAPNEGPTEILPFLFLGSQQDALDPDLLSKYGIKYVINLSVNCPRPESVKQDGHFMRIPVNDSYQEKLLPHFEEAFKFLDKVSQRGSVVLIHCLAGISRSPTLAIAYIMRQNRWTSEEAYRFVKKRRPSISPNFNFMGQLLEYEAILREENRLLSSPGASDCTSSSSNSFAPSSSESCSESPNVFEVNNQKHSELDNSTKIAKSVSCDQIASNCKIARPQSFWDNDLQEPSSKTNENGKRAMQSASSNCPLDRPRALTGLKARKALDVPQAVSEDLPSPSNELQKLSFTPSPSEISASNPFFALSRPSAAPSQPSTSQAPLSVENPTFQQRDHSIEPSCSKSILSSGTVPRILDRISHHCLHLKKGFWPSSNNHNTATGILRSSTISSFVSTAPPHTTLPSVPEISRSQSDYTLDSDSPESGFVEGAGDFLRSSTAGDHAEFISNTDAYRDPDRESISSTSSLEIIVK